jgi:hypothetical protein
MLWLDYQRLGTSRSANSSRLSAQQGKHHIESEMKYRHIEHPSQ